MRSYRKRYYYYYIVFFVVIAVVSAILYQQSLSLFLDEEKNILLDKFYKDGKEDDLQYRLIEGKHVLRFEKTIKGDEIRQLQGDSYKLIVYRLSADWYRVYFNGILIGSIGSDQSYIWNSLENFDIDRGLITEENTLVIEAGAQGDFGLFASPIIITGSDQANRILNWYKISNDNVYTAAMGLTFFIFALLMFLYMSSGSIRSEYLYYALATAVMSINFLDGMVLYHNPIPTLIYVKAVHLSSYLAIIFTAMAIYKQFGEKINKILGYLTLLVFIIMVVFYNNLPDFLNAFYLTNNLVIVNAAGWIYTGIRHFKKLIYARLLTLASIFLFIFCGVEIVILLTGGYYMVSFAVFGVLYFSMGVMLLVVLDYITLQSRIEYERNKARLLYEKSIRDGMTGVYNHQYIAATLEKIKTSFALIILDLDNFKEINDTFGHQTGDYVLKKIVGAIKKRVRKTDLLGRYGGDEFVIILFNCQKSQVKEIAEKIKANIEEPVYTEKGEEIVVSCSMGVYLAENGEEAENVLYKADQALYAAKNRGKSRIVFYGETIEGNGLDDN